MFGSGGGELPVCVMNWAISTTPSYLTILDRSVAKPSWEAFQWDAFNGTSEEDGKSRLRHAKPP